MDDPKSKKNEETPPQNPAGTGGGEKPPEKTPVPGGGLTPEQAKVKELENEINELKRKNSDSAKGVQGLLETQKDLEAKLVKANEALLDKELSEDPDFEMMDEEEKKKFRAKKKKDKELELLAKTTAAKQQMRDDYDSLPPEIKRKIELKGGYGTFRDFACSPDNAGQKNLLNLAKQFLYEETPQVEETPPEEPPKEPDTGLEPGTGGPKELPPKKEGFTAEEAEKLRRENPKRYNELAASGKLNII